MGHSNFRVRKVTKVTLNTYGWPRIPYSKPSFQSVDWQLGNAEWNILKESWLKSMDSHPISYYGMSESPMYIIYIYIKNAHTHTHIIIFIYIFFLNVAVG